MEEGRGGSKVGEGEDGEDRDEGPDRGEQRERPGRVLSCGRSVKDNR